MAHIDAAKLLILPDFSVAASNDPQDASAYTERRRPVVFLYRMLPSLTPITLPGDVPSG